MGACASRRGQLLDSLYDVFEDELAPEQLAGRFHRLPLRLRDEYTVSRKVLGRGMSGAVRMGRSEASNQQVAVKSLSLSMFARGAEKEMEHIASEVEIFVSMDHPHVVKLLDIYQGIRHVHLVMECLKGGTLLEAATHRGRFEDGDAALVAHQMLLAVNYMHNRGVVHRDLKPDNFMFEGPTLGQGVLKLIDFGLSKRWEGGERMAGRSGTLPYMAPEVLDRNYTNMCDLWSLGVIVFRILLGYLPFEADPALNPQLEHLERERLLHRIRTGEYRVLDRRQWEQLSERARDFVTGLICVKAKQRRTAAEALKHPWLEVARGCCERGLTPAQEQTVADRLAKFAQASRFKQACMMLVAWSSSLECGLEGDHAEIFTALDGDKTGTLDFSEFQKLLQASENACSSAEQHTWHLFQTLDTTGDGKIHYSGFLAAMLSSQGAVFTENVLTRTFRHIDVNRDGYITPDDLCSVFGSSFDGVPVEEMLKQALPDHGTRMAYAEFAERLRGDRSEDFAEPRCGQGGKDRPTSSLGH